MGLGFACVYGDVNEGMGLGSACVSLGQVT